MVVAVCPSRVRSYDPGSIILAHASGPSQLSCVACFALVLSTFGTKMECVKKPIYNACSILYAAARNAKCIDFFVRVRPGKNCRLMPLKLHRPYQFSYLVF